MKTLVIVAHPNLSQSRVNRRWMERIAREPGVTVHDLYAAYPDFNIDVEREQRLLMEHDRIVLQFPFYWYSTPALLKQWQDDVLTYGWAYGNGGDKLRGKQLVPALSAGGPQHAYRPEGYNRYTIAELLLPLRAVANLTGMTYLPHFVFHGAIAASDEEIRQSAERYVAHVLDPDLASRAQKEDRVPDGQTAG